MGILFLSASIYFLLSSSSPLLLCVGKDRLERGESISADQTLDSRGGVFSLGFFTPGNPTANRRYVGIWYKQVPGKTVVWVANRENPLRDPSGALVVADDGNLALLDAKRRVLWSTNVSTVPGNSVALLLDSGNLVLGRGDEEGAVWQSFDHPTDTLLPNMKLRWNFRTGVAQSLVSWKDAQDPSPGNSSFGIDSSSSLQLLIKNGSQVRWRSRVWDGQPLNVFRIANSTDLYVETIVANDQEVYLVFTATGRAVLARCLLDPTDTAHFLFWDNNLNKWSVLFSKPEENTCDAYNSCGPSGVCDGTGPSPVCRCLEGFEPRFLRDWEVGSFGGGCVRRMPIKCGKADKFQRLSRMKLPDHFTFLKNTTTTRQCEDECLDRCNCTAYAYGNFSRGDSVESRCLIWVGEFIDIGQYRQFISRGEDLYVRTLASGIGDDASVQMGVDSTNKKHLLVIAMPTLAFGILLMGAFCCFLRRRLKVQEGKRTNRQGVLLSDPKFSDRLESENDISDIPLLDFSSVAATTDNFSTANMIGGGGFGPVYKGTLSQGHEIAVKRLSQGSGQGFQEFANEVKLIAKLQHTNLVRLLGWCIHDNEKILIYDYMPNKSLDKFIFDSRKSAELDWDKRFRIIEGIANGLLYLHRYSRLRIIHRDLKTSNILLDASMNPKISDFGLARIFGGNQMEANTGRVVGTYGYMSPEYALDGLFSEKSDVFSYGVIVLEIISGKRSTGFYPYKGSLNLLGYAWRLWEDGRGLELGESSVGSSIRAPEVLKCIKLGLPCVQENAEERPTMSSVVSLLSNENATLPSPRQPAFAVGRHPTPGVADSSSRTPGDSVNNMTISVVEGR